MFLTFTSLKNSWTGAFSFTLHLHVDTISQATVGVGLPVFSTDRLIETHTETVAHPFMCHLYRVSQKNAPMFELAVSPAKMAPEIKKFSIWSIRS